MALITNSNITSQIAALANSGTIDTTQLLNIINGELSPSDKLGTVNSMVSAMGIYKRFTDFDTINAKPEIVTTGLFSGDTGSLTVPYTSSTQASSTSGKYYLNVYSTSPATDSGAEVQFAVAYGHLYASGSADLNYDTNSTYPTKAIYTQYRSMLLTPGDTTFSFTNSSGVSEGSNDIYVINLSRNRFRQSVDPGNWQLTLSGSNGLRTFIDNSGKTLSDSAGLSGRVFQIVSGSINYTAATTTVSSATAPNGKGFGLFYPDRGVFVFNPSALGSSVGNVPFSTGSGHIETGNLSGSLLTTINTYNQQRLYSAIKGGADFDCRRTETISTQHFFLRITNKEFNFSNNPTFVDATGSFRQPSFETEPYTYITTIGLYNDSNEMVAVAKTSQPIPKSFDREALIKVKLSY